MNKNLMLIIGGVVGLAVAGGVFFMMNKDDDSNTQNNTGTNNSSNEATSNEEEHSEEQGNIFSISDSGKARYCELTYSGANGTGTGKMYTDGKGRGLMNLDLTTEKGNIGQSNTLVTTDKVYSWTISGDTSFGFVYPKDKFSTSANPAGSSSTSVDPNQQFNLDCHDWKVEESKLTAPANVNFTSVPS